MESFISENDKVHTSTDNKTIIVGETKKKWMMLPPELGSKKCNVIDQFFTGCQCGKHTTTIYILEGKYCTMYCNSAGGWAWVEKPVDAEIKKLKEIGIRLKANKY